MVHLRHYNQIFELGLSDEEITTLSGQYQKTFDVPILQELRQRDEVAFQQARETVRTSEQVHLELEVLAGAVEAALLLAAHAAQLGYFTVRPDLVRQATHQWLRNHGFPNPDFVIICTDHGHKILAVLEEAITADQQAILIDDSLVGLMDAAEELAAQEPELASELSRLTLVGFAVKAELLPQLIQRGEAIGIKVVNLDSWGMEVLDTVLGSTDQHNEA